MQKRVVTIFSSLALLLALFAGNAWCQDKGDVTVSLTAHKVLKGEGGKETFEPADKAKPGDIIEYRALYRNTGSKPVKDLLATLPVPDSTEYLTGTAAPVKVTASLDGKKFSAVPLKRKVKLSDGREVTRDIPSAEYRALRWDLKELAAGESMTVKARVRIISAIEIKR